MDLTSIDNDPDVIAEAQKRQAIQKELKCGLIELLRDLLNDRPDITQSQLERVNDLIVAVEADLAT